jgi:hypothetical protein
MTEADRDEKVSAGYRALGCEEPPRALDDAILERARHRPSRWRVPLSVAAVLVLAVGVTLRMLPQQPQAESLALAPQVLEAPRPAAPAPRPKAAEAPQPAAPAPAQKASEAPRPAAPVQESKEPVAPAAGAADAVGAVASAPGLAAESRLRKESSAKLAQAELTPEAWLTRIAELRKQGRTREADESLAEFKKRYPDYRIPEPLR